MMFVVAALAAAAAAAGKTHQKPCGTAGSIEIL